MVSQLTQPPASQSHLLWSSWTASPGGRWQSCRGTQSGEPVALSHRRHQGLGVAQTHTHTQAGLESERGRPRGPGGWSTTCSAALVQQVVGVAPTLVGTISGPE